MISEVFDASVLELKCFYRTPKVSADMFILSFYRGNRNVTLTLSWNVVPNAGILPLVTGSGHVSVPFPDTYEITKSY